MAMKIKTACCFPGCGRATNSRFCDEHSKDTGRISSARRGYGRSWRRLRLRYLQQNPICEMSYCSQPATEVDHVLERVRGGSDSPSNLQALCKPCHSRKTLDYARARDGRNEGLILIRGFGDLRAQ